MQLRPIEWLGDSRERLRDWPKAARYRAGVELRLVQSGANPTDWKPFATVGPGVVEVRISAGGQFRIFLVARFDDAVFVLHSFSKKSQKTSQQDVDLARKRYSELKESRR